MANDMLTTDVRAALLRDTGQVNHGLNLVLPLADPARMCELLLKILAAQPNIQRALDELHFVHFARFLPTPDNTALLVITEFDGPLEPYVMDFAIAIGTEFTMMLEYVLPSVRPKLPVQKHPESFWEFVRDHNRVRIAGVPLPEEVDYPLYSAYRRKTVLDIVGPRTRLPPPVQDHPSAAIDLQDVQGNILKGYDAWQARHLVLEVVDAAAARAWLAALADAAVAGVPAITTAEPWPGGAKPKTLLNVGFTHAGLLALGAGPLDAFPAAFREGPADPKRAAANGDSDDSAPARWVLGGQPERAHAMLSLQGFQDTMVSGSQAAFDAASAAIDAALAGAGLAVVSDHRAEALPDGKEHFGYRDGVAQPRIAHPCAVPDDMQPAASPGEFLLGPDYCDIFGGPSIGALPQTLALNGTYCAVRLLQQHVDVFDKVLDDGAAATGASRALVAAKLVGRWQDGVPLELYPDDASWAAAPAAAQKANAFDYAPSYEYPNTVHDHDGLRCPVGAHIRRANPRTARVAGVRHGRRLFRRGMPYTLPAAGGAAPEKGLFGLFVCGSLERQFEFIQQQWINGDIFASGIRGTQDAIVGAASLSGQFLLPGMGAGGSVAELPVPRLTTTRGSLYLFLPGLNALRSLAPAVLREFIADDARGVFDPNRPIDSRVAFSLERDIRTVFDGRCLDDIGRSLFLPDPVVRPRAQRSPSAAADFDPQDPAFLADPYPTYARFRASQPVLYVPKHAAYWVFKHDDVVKLYGDTATYLKLPPGSNDPRGLFTMEEKRHKPVRKLLNTAFGVAMADARAIAERETQAALDDLAATPCFDFVEHFARRIPREVLFEVIGIPQQQRSKVDRRARKVLMHADRTLDAAQRLIGQVAGAKLALQLALMLPPALFKRSLLGQIARLTAIGSLSVIEATMTLLQFVLGGYLSTEFLLCTGTRNLLLGGGTAWTTVRDRPAHPEPTTDPVLLDAIDEMRRYDTPLAFIDRHAAHDINLGGVAIPAGARVLGVLGSANHDTRVFGADAETFDIARTLSAQNLALGTGTRDCIGKPLQAIVAPVAFSLLMQRMPALHLLSDAVPPWMTDPYFRSFTRLMVSSA